MTILFLSSAHPADDRRVVLLEAASLAEAGFAVLHLCPEGRQPPAAVPTWTLRRRPGLAGRLAILPRLLAGAIRIRPTTIHASEPDAWAVALLAKAVTGCAVVFDAHEDYADPCRLGRLPAPFAGRRRRRSGLPSARSRAGPTRWCSQHRASRRAFPRRRIVRRALWCAT